LLGELGNEDQNEKEIIVQSNNFLKKFQLYSASSSEFFTAHRHEVAPLAKEKESKVDVKSLIKRITKILNSVTMWQVNEATRRLT